MQIKVSVEEREGLFKALSVEVEGDVVKRALEEVYQHLRENAQIEGFRKGQAPLWLIRARYRDYIEEEVGKKVADATLSAAIEESKLKPVADIYLEEVKLEELTGRLTYRVSFEVPPQFELAQIEGMEIEIPKVEYSEKMLQEQIERLREEHAVWEPVEREAREGDLVVIEYEITDKETGEKVKGETSGVLGQKIFREEVEKSLLGKKEGDEVRVEDVDVYDPSGKMVGKADMTIRIKGVKEKVLPEPNDDFARELKLGDTWQEALKKLEEEIKARLEDLRREMVMKAVASKLLQMHQFDLPQTEVMREVSYLLRQRLGQLEAMGIDTRYVDVRKMAEELLPQASANVKLRYILDRYAQEKQIEVTEEELKKEIDEQAKRSGVSPDEMRKFLQERGLEEVLRRDVIRNKALEDIMSKVVIKEVEEKEDEGNS
ncbi:trigger factor [Thermocrinis albus DSM 14484]|uniref:Trigger factor n=1 Tax=Thermocrinis albus (strain DSM 14484 / JCM 11386 / HI 11/12) TaxID=638303 RepID=D3SPX8_THEAH|nr:trigger factor [Thermocrinis albus]ADC89215.1 trigger factor [Thermocrinis albus DSM 14484]